MAQMSPLSPPAIASWKRHPAHLTPLSQYCRTARDERYPKTVTSRRQSRLVSGGVREIGEKRAEGAYALGGAAGYHGEKMGLRGKEYQVLGRLVLHSVQEGIGMKMSERRVEERAGISQKAERRGGKQEAETRPLRVVKRNEAADGWETEKQPKIEGFKMERGEGETRKTAGSLNGGREDGAGNVGIAEEPSEQGPYGPGARETDNALSLKQTQCLSYRGGSSFEKIPAHKLAVLSPATLPPPDTQYLLGTTTSRLGLLEKPGVYEAVPGVSISMV
ncbi:hypothetical protein BD779DRAFT_1476091 [Infundibulicybe gibba]|nr:hypothetical protein BD779DRAFT_1476091 [Infundibulicybe gibba]